MYIVKTTVLVLQEKSEDSAYRDGSIYLKDHSWFDNGKLEQEPVYVCRNYIDTIGNVLGFVKSFYIDQNDHIVAEMLIDDIDPYNEIIVRNSVFVSGCVIEKASANTLEKKGRIERIGVIRNHPDTFPYKRKETGMWREIKESKEKLVLNFKNSKIVSQEKQIDREM